MNMNSGEVFPIIVLSIVFVAVVIITVSIVWMEHRKRTRVLDVLRVYAERGEEPPTSVNEALTQVSGGKPLQPAKPTTRGTHLSHAAPNAVFTVGFAAIAWWRFTAFGETGPTVVVPILAALFFLASLTARLVGAYYAPDR
jgi:hypothetical protein